MRVFNSGEEFLLKVRLKYLPTAHSKYFFLVFLYSYDDWPSFPFSNRCLKKENLQAHFTSVPSPWQNAQPQYDAFKPFPPQTQGFHHMIILPSGGGEAGLGDMIPFEQRETAAAL